MTRIIVCDSPSQFEYLCRRERYDRKETHYIPEHYGSSGLTSLAMLPDEIIFFGPCDRVSLAMWEDCEVRLRKPGSKKVRIKG